MTEAKSLSISSKLCSSIVVSKTSAAFLDGSVLSLTIAVAS